MAIDPPPKLLQLLELVEVAHGAAVSLGGHGQVTPEVTPDVDDERDRAAAFDRLQLLGRRRHLAAQGGIDGSTVADEVGGGAQARAPVGRQELQQGAADAGARDQGLGSAREADGQTRPSTGGDGQRAGLCRLGMATVDEQRGERGDGRGREAQAGRA